MAGRLLTMSAKELDRLEVIRRVAESQLSQVKAGELLDLTSRQVRRLCRAFEATGPSGLVSLRRAQQVADIEAQQEAVEERLQLLALGQLV